jgi:hypothetical protein
LRAWESGSRACSLERRSEIWSSEIELDDDSEVPARRERDLRLLDDMLKLGEGT